MPYQCPYCSTIGTYRNNIRNHLMGTKPYGGHELSRLAAEEVIENIESGRPTKALEFYKQRSGNNS